MVIFGAGGAARAVSVELALAGASAEYRPWDRTVKIPPGTDIVINATAIGLYPDVDGRLDLDLSTITPEMVVADGIHNPPKAHLLRSAEARGCRLVDGLAILVNQGVIGIQYWTGVDVDATVMRRTLEEIFKL